MLTCQTCSKEFKRTHYERKRRPSLYCSVSCSNKSRIKQLQNADGSRLCQSCKTVSRNFRPKSMLRCRDCENEDRRKWYAKNRERALEMVRRNHIKRKYQITLEEYDEMIKKGCAICGGHSGMAVDHNHVTGKVRGALCRGCNVGLGLFNDDVERLKNAIKYLS